MYGVYMAARKLKHYFEEHPITVVSTTPLSEIIGCKVLLAGWLNGRSS
jgi:hypothetical protein